jgi:hypothetical protein
MKLSPSVLPLGEMRGVERRSSAPPRGGEDRVGLITNPRPTNEGPRT